jgi:preprotein translocase subunit SecY
MKFIDTLKNIYKIEELRKRILFTLGLLLIYRLGTFVTLPGVNNDVLSHIGDQYSDGSLLGLLNVFSGGAFSQASIFALGVMPYITASIIIQLLGIMVPYFRKMQREGESGRRKMNQWTRFLTIVVLLLQAPAYLTTQVMNWAADTNGDGVLESVITNNDSFLGIPGGMFIVPAVIVLIAGTMFIMWLGEKITDRGIGNGVSLIIMIGIVARLPQALFAEATDSNIILFIVELIFLALVFMLAIAVVQAVRRIPVQYAKRIVGNKQYGGVRQYIPLKLNAANVMPIIFAQALMFIPGLIWPNNPVWFIDGWAYNVVLAVMVIAFTFFYTAIIVNPQMMADDMKRNGGFIPGVKPGKSTVKYIDDVMTRITLPGSLFLALITILPAIAMALNVETSFAYFFGGTSLLIMVGVVLDTLKQIESYLLMRHYDGLMKTGRIQGRY